MSEPTREAELLARIAELERKLTIQQSGSGAVAAGGKAAAAGAGGVAVAGDIRGSVYLGAPPEDEAQALAIYRRVPVSGCRQLPLRGVDVGVSDPTGSQKQMDLDQVYVALDTRGHRTIRRSLGEVLRQTQTVWAEPVKCAESCGVACRRAGFIPLERTNDRACPVEEEEKAGAGALKAPRRKDHVRPLLLGVWSRWWFGSFCGEYCRSRATPSKWRAHQVVRWMPALVAVLRCLRRLCGFAMAFGTGR